MPVANWSNRDFCSASQLRIHYSTSLASFDTDLGLECTDSPEISYDLILFRVTPVICVLLPVLHINVCNATDEKFQLPLIKYIDKIRRYELVEASHKCVELRLDSLLNSPLGDKTNTISRTNEDVIQNARRTQYILSWFH